MATLNADIAEIGSGGVFEAVCRETGTRVKSTGPENALRRALLLAGCDDGPIQFWRGATPSLLYPSLTRRPAKESRK